MPQHAYASVLLVGAPIVLGFPGLQERSLAESVATAKQTLTVLTATKISEPSPHTWWNLAVDPNEARRLVVCTLVPDPKQARQLVSKIYGSKDGGGTWSLLFTEAVGMVASEVGCTIDADGKVYFVSSRALQVPTFVTAPIERLSTSFRTTVDFGETWQENTLGNVYMDATTFVASSSQALSEHVFAFSDESGPLVRSLDGVRPGPPVSLIGRSDSMPEGTLNLLDAAALNNGRMGALYMHTEGRGSDAERELLFFHANVGEQSTGAPIRLAAVGSRFDAASAPDPLAVLRRNGQAALAVATNSNGKSEVLAVWIDSVDGRARIRLARSETSGATWSAVQIVDDLPDTVSPTRDNNAYLPSIAVSPQGLIGIQWAEFAGRCWRFAYSDDGARTFYPSIAINPCSSEPVGSLRGLGQYLTVAPTPENARRKGGEVPLTVLDWRIFQAAARVRGLVATGDHSFYSAWSPLGVADTALYGSHITVQAPQPNASSSSKLVPAPDSDAARVWIDYVSLAFDENLRELSVVAVLMKPKDTLTWPITWRTHHVSSRLGRMSAVNADNGVSGIGAEWQFLRSGTTLLTGTSAAMYAASALQAGYEASAPRTLRFRFEAPPNADKVPAHLPLVGILTATGELLVSQSSSQECSH